MQFLLGFLPLVLAFDTRENSTSTTSEPRPTKVYSGSTKALRYLGRALDGPVLVPGLVHQQRFESKEIKRSEKSEKVNNGEKGHQRETTEQLPLFQRSTHQKEEKSPLQTKSVEFHLTHQLHQTSTDQKLGGAVSRTEKSSSGKKLEEKAALVEFHPKVDEIEEKQHSDLVVEQKLGQAVPKEKTSSQKKLEEEIKENMRHSGFEVDEEGRAHLPVDPFSLHHPFLHTSVAEFEYSEWYLLLFLPSNASLPVPNTDSLTNQLSRSLAEKLEVSSSIFHISSIDSNRNVGLSANISLTRLTVPHLHRNLCHLPKDGPVFEFDGKNFTLATVRHDKNQHLYIRTNPSTTTTGDELGLLLTVTLGGLGMFLLVMAFSFLAAQIVSKQDLSGVSDLEDILVEHREASVDSCDVLEKEIFIIDNSDESEGLHHEGFCAGEERRPAGVSKEETRRWKEERGEERVSRRIQFGRLGSRLGRSWRQLWGAPRLIDID